MFSETTGVWSRERALGQENQSHCPALAARGERREAASLNTEVGGCHRSSQRDHPANRQGTGVSHDSID